MPKVITFFVLINLIVISDVSSQINYVFNTCEIQTKDLYSGIVDTVYNTPIGKRSGFEYGIDFCAVVIDTTNHTIVIDYISRINPELNFKLETQYVSIKWASYGVKEYNIVDNSLIRWDGTYLSYRNSEKTKKYIFNKFGVLIDQPSRIK